MTVQNDMKVLNLSLLKVDETYTVPVHDNKDIVENFDPRAVGFITVSERKDGNFYIVDGVRRVSALLEKGYEHWECIVHNDLTIEDEARIYTLKNKSIHNETVD